jgi:hypothetical protein
MSQNGTLKPNLNGQVQTSKCRTRKYCQKPSAGILVPTTSCASWPRPMPAASGARSGRCCAGKGCTRHTWTSGASSASRVCWGRRSAAAYTMAPDADDVDWHFAFVTCPNSCPNLRNPIVMGGIPRNVSKHQSSDDWRCVPFLIRGHGIRGVYNA